MPLPQSIIDKAAQVLQEWGNEATFEMQRLLKARLKVTAQVSDLAQSIDFEGSKVTTKGAVAIWNLNDYWVYVDLGVKGTRNRAKTFTSKQFPGGFKFKTPYVGFKMQNAIGEYIVRKGIKPEINGKRVTNKQKAFQMATAIKRKGIDGTRFYSDVFNDKGFKKLTDRLARAVGEEMEVRIVAGFKDIK